MKAIGLYRYLPTSDPDCFVEVDLPTPRPTGHDLLVRVEAVSVNPVDTKQRAPRPDVERDPKILGWDAAGVVAAVGDAVTLFQPGDEVYYAGSLVRPGCNSELHLVDERIVGHKPRSLTMAQAAAMPLTTITAWEALFVRMGIEPRTAPEEPARTILIIAGAGGVGSIAIQLAKQVAGLQVIATASRPETSAWCEAMGADHVVNHHQPLEAELQRIGIAQVDYIFCCSHLEQYIEQMPAIIAPFGFVCSIVGMKDGQPLKVTLWTQSDSIFRRLTEVVQAQLKAVGIEAEITTFDSSTIRDQYKTGEQQLAVRSYNWDNADIVDWFFGGDRLGYPNVSMFNDPKAEELRAAAMTGARNMDERIANFTAYHEYVLTQFPMAPIYQPVQAMAYNTDRIALPEKIDAPAFGAAAFLDLQVKE